MDSTGRLKNPSSLLRYSQINGFAMSLQQKVRVRLPKLLVVKNTMQKGKKKMIKWTKPAGLLPKEIGSIFCNASRNKKLSQRDSSSFKNDGHGDGDGDADALDECMEERDQLIVSGKKGNMFKTLLEDSVERLTLSKSCSFKKILRIIDTKEKPLELNDEQNSEISTGSRKQPRILPRKLSGLFEFRFRKRIGFCFTNWKTNKADPGIDFEGAVTNAETQEMSKTFNWASIKRKKAGYCIITRVKSIHKRVVKQGRECKHEDEEEQEKVGLELCKKRILMGGKCRPLSASGSLHYDQNGILLPEFPYQEL